MDWIFSNTMAALVIGILIGYHIGKTKGAPSVEQTKLRQQDLDKLIASLSTTERYEVEMDLRKNRRLSAIKVFRKATNAGLKDSIDAVKKMMRSH